MLQKINNLGYVCFDYKPTFCLIIGLSLGNEDSLLTKIKLIG